MFFGATKTKNVPVFLTLFMITDQVVIATLFHYNPPHARDKIHNFCDPERF